MDKQEILVKLMHFCSYRERSIYEVMQKLKSLQVDESHQAAVVSKLIAENFLNEIRFVKAFVNDKFYLNQWGKIKIKQKISAFQPDAFLVEQALQNIEENDYLIAIKKCLNKFLSLQKNNLLSNKLLLKQKAFQHCLNKGFEWDKINIVWQQISDKS